MTLFSFFKSKHNKNEAKSSNEASLNRDLQFSSIYSYEWKEEVPENERNTESHPSRPFCAKLLELNRLYTRVEIESMSKMLGYSLFDRCGGPAFIDEETGMSYPECRHYWKVQIVSKEIK